MHIELHTLFLGTIGLNPKASSFKRCKSMENATNLFSSGGISEEVHVVAQ